MNDYKRIKDGFKEAKSLRSNWNVMYQVLGEFISQIKQDFEGQPANGEFLTDEIFDSTGTFAAFNSAAALLGMLWPGAAAQAIEIKAPDDMEDSTELAEFYENMSKVTTKAMDDPKANLSMALDEYMLDNVIFGTAGVGVESGFESKLLYKPYGVRELFIDEGKNGRVNKIWLYYEWSAERVADEYGIENVSEKTRKLIKDGNKHAKVRILHALAPRKEKLAEKGNLSMPVESIHLEFDDCHLLQETGFNELPIAIGRLRKLAYEKMGRGFGQAALPDIREANALRESIIIATEKALNMPQGVISDGIMGSGYFDTSANAVNVFDAASNVGNSSPVFEIGSPPNVAIAEKRLEELKQTISQHFNIDRLLDFNNETQMTFGEAQIRDQRSMNSLAGLFNRQITEIFTPVIERSVGILFRAGEFGVAKGSQEELDIQEDGREVTYFPEAIQKRLEDGLDIYQIAYRTKASNASKAQDYIGILDVMGFAAQAMEIDPSISNRIDLHEGIKIMADIRGMPAGIIRKDDEVEAIEAKQQEAAQKQEMIETMGAGATIAKDVAQAQAMEAQ